MQTTQAKFGGIDILANIASAAIYDWFEELSAEEIQNPFEVNVIARAELIWQTIPCMKAQRSGLILNMSSYVSRIAVPPMEIYTSIPPTIPTAIIQVENDTGPSGKTIGIGCSGCPITFTGLFLPTS